MGLTELKSFGNRLAVQFLSALNFEDQTSLYMIMKSV